MTPPKNTPPVLAIYNPALLKKEDLIRGFVARQLLLDRLLDDLRREEPGSTPQHHLIIGQRGLGKTTLLLRLAFAVEDDPKLNAAWIPLVFPEEQYNVAGLADFWLNCVDALSDALDRAGFREASQTLDARVEKVPAASADRSTRALNLLLEESARLGRRILLLVDNLDIVLDRLKNEEEWEFRRIISQERGLHFMGASSRVLEALYEHGRAFYDFFQVHELKEFDEEETISTLTRLAEHSGDERVVQLVRSQPGRIKALHVLTGGNPRTLVLLYKVLSQGPEGDVQRDIEQLLDDYTALYKARFEELAPQAQQVVDAMAIHWDPLTAADLTGKLGPLNVNQVSAQLKRLEDIGVVEKTPWFGEKKNAYQIAERFFNIWYLMRASRRVRRRLLWLVKFLEMWFDRKELSERARDFLEQDPETMGRERYAELALAYSQAVPDRHLQRNLESASLHAVLDDGVRRLIDFSDLPPELQNKKERMQKLLGLRERTRKISINWGEIARAEFWRVLGGSPHLSLMEKERIVEQLPLLHADGLRELYEKLERAETHLRQMCRAEPEAVARLYQALSEGDMAGVYDWENALAVARRYGLRRLPFIAIGSRASTYVVSEKLSAEETKLAEDALQAMTQEQGVESLAWTGLGNLLQGHLARYEEAERAYRRAIELEPQNPDPRYGLGKLLQERLKRYEEAAQAYRSAIDLDPKFPHAWNNLGYLLQAHLKRYEEAEQAYRRAIELDPQLPHPWNGLGNLLQDHLERYEEAEQAYRRAIELGPQLPHPWSNLGRLLERLSGRDQEAADSFLRAFELDSSRSWDLDQFLRACDRLVESGSDLAEVLKRAQRAHQLAPDHTGTQFLAGRILTLIGKWPEASQILETVAAKESADFSIPFFRTVVEKGHLDEAIAILERTGAKEWWRPIYEALGAARAGTPDQLRTVAPEIRMVATRILREIASSLFQEKS